MNISTPKISVLLLCYKQEDTIKRAVDSLLAQKNFIYEICVSDDCSPDGTWELLQEYSLQYPGLFKLHRNLQNVGIFKNIEYLWTMPTGNVITMLAGDDECGPGWFEHVYESIERNEIDVESQLFCIYGDYIQRNKDGAEVRYSNKLVKDNNALKLKIRKLLYGRGACYSRKVLNLFEPVSEGRSFNAELVQDCQLQLFTKKNYYIPFVSNIYYAEIGVSTRMTKKERVENIYDGYARFINFVNSKEVVIDKKDLFYIEYMKSYRSGEKSKALRYYIKSIDPSLGVAGLQLSRIRFVLKNRILKKK